MMTMDHIYTPLVYTLISS